MTTATVSVPWKPVIVEFNTGFVAPYARLWLFALTSNPAGFTGTSH